MFAFVTRVKAKPGKRDALKALNQEMQAATAQEDDVPVYIFHTAEDDPNDFWFYDLYATQQAYDEHCQTDSFQKMMANIGDLADIIEMKKLVPFGTIKSAPVDNTNTS